MNAITRVRVRLVADILMLQMGFVATENVNILKSKNPRAVSCVERAKQIVDALDGHEFSADPITEYYRDRNRGGWADCQ